MNLTILFYLMAAVAVLIWIGSAIYFHYDEQKN